MSPVTKVTQIFKNPSPSFLKVLSETGPVPGGEKRKLDGPDEIVSRKKGPGGWTGKPQDMERLAAGIEQLPEADLMPIIKIILDNRTPDMYIKSDVEGCFSWKWLMA
jgi:transcription initiation factor TFIID/TFIIF subunit